VKRRIVTFTGGRADWGLLSLPTALLAAHPTHEVIVVATGQHAGPLGTLTVVEREFSGRILAIDMLLRGDSGAAISSAMARLQHELTRALAELAPDLLLLLGDRYEVLTAATVATLLNVPIAHIAGGDITEGAIDDAMRHAVSKLSHLHFVTNADARRRLLAMGEQPGRIVLSGSPGIDRLLAEPALPRGDFFAEVGLRPRERNVVATFHPVTLADDSQEQLGALIAALADLGEKTGIIFTGVNSDPGFSAIDAAIARFCEGRDNVVRRASLGSRLYANALRHSDAVVGNSSSGLYEAPTFGTPTVNIGDRQAGRLRAQSVIDAAPTPSAITAAIAEAFRRGRSTVVNPYGDGCAAANIAQTIAGMPDFRALLRKRFYESTT
jgi:UDP-hydrolysing UDP-N-acetyl-D-glucosamine 2-epimerase